MPYRSMRKLMRSLSQALVDKPFEYYQAFDDKYWYWEQWALLYNQPAEGDPMSPSYHGNGSIRVSPLVSELQRYHAEYFMWKYNCKFFTSIRIAKFPVILTMLYSQPLE